MELPNTQFWIGLLTGLSGASLVWVKLIRRHYHNLTTIDKKVRELEQTKHAIREIFNRVYHREIFPEIRRAMGLWEVTIMEIDEAIKDVIMAKRPNHHKYSNLVHKRLKDLRMWAERGKAETTRLSDRFSAIIKPFEDLQDDK